IEICRRLDGLPLAIELAAARVKLLPPAALLARLRGADHAHGAHVAADQDGPSASSLQFLTGGACDLPVRQQTLRAAIVWSYNLLSAADQTLFRRLGVFAGGWTLDAAEAVCADQTGDDYPAAGRLPSAVILDGLASLQDKSLIRRQESAVLGNSGSPRFAMLETLREFALEQLERANED